MRKGLWSRTMERIYHIASAADWQAALRCGEGSYRLSTRGKSLAEVGFIHCSYANQVVRVANAIYPDERGLVLLTIDPGRLKSPLKDENLEGGSEVFPHIYGPLNLDAVIEVRPFDPALRIEG